MRKQKRPREPSHFIKRYVEVATEVLAECMGATRCLNGTRVCIDALRHFGVRARPCSVTVMAMNEVYAKRSREIGRFPQNPEELDEWVAAGGWAIGTDHIDHGEQNAWPGHLVALAQNCLIDSAACGFSRPARSIELPDIFVGLTNARFLKGKDSLAFRLKNDAVVIYRQYPDPSFLRQPGFQRHEENNKVVEEIVGRMRGKVESAPR